MRDIITNCLGYKLQHGHIFPIFWKKNNPKTHGFIFSFFFGW